VGVVNAAPTVGVVNAAPTHQIRRGRVYDAHRTGQIYRARVSVLRFSLCYWVGETATRPKRRWR
jgi:hypothetical protein